MNLIDIASWQAGLDLEKLFRLNPTLDGVIVKLTQGTGYVNPEADAWINWLIDNGKPFGTYHYPDKAGAKAEAQHYANQLGKYPGGVPAIDYEEGTLALGTGYLKECLDEVYRLTGVKPLVYCSQSVTQSQDFSAIAASGYRLWVAQYADMNPVHGFLPTPWQKGSVAPFDGFVMQQYTSTGYLDGWNGNLDFDLFYGTEEDWAALAGGSAPAPAPEPEPQLKGPDPVVIGDILDNKYGVGASREKNLRRAGFDPQKCQAKVNALYAIAAKIKPLVAGNMEYLNQIIKIVRQR